MKSVKELLIKDTHENIALKVHPFFEKNRVKHKKEQNFANKNYVQEKIQNQDAFRLIHVSTPSHIDN